MASHLHVDSVPFGWRNIRVCGQPWHGTISRIDGVWSMLLENGLVKSVADLPGIASAFGPNTAETQLVAVPGMPAPPALSPALQAQGLKFYADAILWGESKRYNPESTFELGQSNWLYVDANAAVWRMGIIQGASQRLSETSSRITLIVVCHGRFGLVDGTTQAPGFRTVGAVVLDWTHPVTLLSYAPAPEPFVFQTRSGVRAGVLLGHDLGANNTDTARFPYNIIPSGVAELTLVGDGTGEKGTGITCGGLVAYALPAPAESVTMAPQPGVVYVNVSWDGAFTGQQVTNAQGTWDVWDITIHRQPAGGSPNFYEAERHNHTDTLLAAAYDAAGALQVFVQRVGWDALRSMVDGYTGGQDLIGSVLATPGQQPNLGPDPALWSVWATGYATPPSGSYTDFQQRTDYTLLLRNGTQLERGEQFASNNAVTTITSVTGLTINYQTSSSPVGPLFSNWGTVSRYAHNCFGWHRNDTPAAYSTVTLTNVHGPDVTRAVNFTGPNVTGQFPNTFSGLKAAYNPRTQTIAVVSNPTGDVQGACPV